MSQACSSYPTVRRWLARVKEGPTRNGYLLAFERWIKWIKENGGTFATMTPDELVAFQDTAMKHNRYQLLDLAVEYIEHEFKGRSGGTKRRNMGVIASFFMHSRAPLPRDPGIRLKGDKPKTIGKLTAEEVARIAETSSPPYRAMFLCMLGAGMGYGEVEEWSRGGIEPVIKQLHSGATEIRVDFAGRKSHENEEPYFTYVGGDALDALKAWLKVRPPEPGDIFLTNWGTPITYLSTQQYWMRKLKRLGLVDQQTGMDLKDRSSVRYGKGLHEIRDIFRSRWTMSGAEAVAAEFMMGHSRASIDPNEYNKPFNDPEWVRGEYRRALRWLNIVTDDPSKVPRAEVEDIRRQLEEAKAGSNGRVSELEAKNMVIEAKLDRTLKALEEIYDRERPKT